jgi:nucleoside-diphosphate-sugar epimerase
MRILVTGNLGYAGPVVMRHLHARWPDAALLGFDAGWFAPSGAGLPCTQHLGDVRDIDASLLAGVDAVVHLAAVSNDPLGDRFTAATGEINGTATLRLASLAAACGVRRLVFASSCSVYGAGGTAARRECDAARPLTEYARSKLAAEAGLLRLATPEMAVTCLRFATACGASEHLRLDLVLNDFVAGALATGRIVLRSDGTPWRPLIDVQDMARAIGWAIARDVAAGGAALVVNAGQDAANYRVADLARAVAAALPGTQVALNPAAAPDSRSYRVDFALFRSLAPADQPQVALEASIAGLASALRACPSPPAAVRLHALADLQAAGRLGCDLRWLEGHALAA